MSDPTPVAPADRLIDAVQRLAHAGTLDEVMVIVNETARGLSGADGACFVLRDGEQCYYADEDAVGPLWKGKRFPLHTCVSGWVMTHRQPAVIPDVFADGRVPHDVYRRTFVKSLVMVPMRTLGPVGAVGAYWAVPDAPTAEAVRWLQSLADAAALALEYVRTQDEERAAREQAAALRAENARLRADAEAGGGEPGGEVRCCFVTHRYLMGGKWVTADAVLEEWFGVKVLYDLSPEGKARLAAETPRPPARVKVG